MYAFSLSLSSSAAKRSDLDYYQRTRVEALIAQMTPVVLDLRRHKIKPEDQGKFAPAVSACASKVCATLSSGRNTLPLQ